VAGARRRAVRETLDLRDLEVPAGLDGQPITVRTSATVRQSFVGERRRVELVQGRSPEVSLPAGLDLERLGEIGLRIAGLDAGEARRFARSIDWHTTLVMPVPLDAASFTEVSVHGQRGLLVQSSAPTRGGDPHRRRPGRMLLWSEGDMVFALGGNLDEMAMVEMAESLR